jgi:hypothetical protein
MSGKRIGNSVLGIIGLVLLALVWKIVDERPRGSGSSSEPKKVVAPPPKGNQDSPASSATIRKKPRPVDQAVEESWENQPIQKLVAIRKKERPKFRLMDSEGYVTSQAIEAHGLNDIQASELKSATAAMRAAIREQLLKNIVKDEERSKPGSVAYRIKPFVEESNKIISRFMSDVSKSVGESAAWNLTNAIPVEQDAGGYGLYEVILSVNEPPAEQVVGMSDSDVRILHSVSYQYRDAETGREVSGGVASMSAFNAQFYDLFE